MYADELYKAYYKAHAYIMQQLCSPYFNRPIIYMTNTFWIFKIVILFVIVTMQHLSIAGNSYTGNQLG